MNSFLKSLGSVLVGFVAASAVMMIVEFLNGHVFYPALGKAAEGIRDREAMRALMAAAPKGALLVVLSGWALGGCVGGLVAGKLAPKAPLAHGAALALLLSLFVVLNDLMIPPPLWFWIAGLLIIGPLTLLGAARAA